MTQYVCLKDKISSKFPGKCPMCGEELKKVFDGESHLKDARKNDDDGGVGSRDANF